VALFGATRRKPALDDGAALAAFMDAEAEAFATIAVDDYARARAQTDILVLFAEPRFAAVLAVARTEAFPLALTMVAEMIESALSRQPSDRAARLHGLIAVAREVFDSRSEPLPTAAEDTAGIAMVRWLADAASHPPRTTDEIVEPFAPSMLALMPIHDALGRDDYPLLRNALRATLAAIRDRFIAAMDAPALAAALEAKK
jgi:hypothetical protein